MPETTSQFGHREGGRSKAFTYMGDLWCDEQDFYHKLTKNAVIWVDFPRMGENEKWFIAGEKGDSAKGFANEYGKFFKMLKERIDKEDKNPFAQHLKPENYIQ